MFDATEIASVFSIALTPAEAVLRKELSEQDYLMRHNRLPKPEGTR